MNGIKSPWGISKKRLIGSDDNPNGPCRIEKNAKRVDLKQFGIKIGNKKQLFLHQAVYAYEFGHLQRNEHVIGPHKKKKKKNKTKKKTSSQISKPQKKKTRPRRSCRRDKEPAWPQNQQTKKKKTSTHLSTALVIAHSCGRWNCSAPRHMDIVPHADNLIHVRCHDDLRVQNRSDCLSGTNETFGLGRDCRDRHAGLRCHYNFSNGPDTKTANRWIGRKRNKRGWEL